MNSENIGLFLAALSSPLACFHCVRHSGFLSVEEERERGRQGGREGGMEGGREGGRDGGRQGGREGGTEGGREGGREGIREVEEGRGEEGGRRERRGGRKKGEGEWQSNDSHYRTRVCTDTSSHPFTLFPSYDSR